MNIIDTYKESLQAIYDHVGFKEDWVVYPIDDKTDMVWSVDDGEIKFAETLDKYNLDGDYYTAEICTQRFYDKWIYRGKDFTMIFGNPHTDGMIWFYLFSNENEVI